jgi:hypothetical protein
MTRADDVSGTYRADRAMIGSQHSPGHFAARQRDPLHPAGRDRFPDLRHVPQRNYYR